MEKHALYDVDLAKKWMRPNRKICVFRVTLPHLIFLVKPSNFFHVFSKKKKKKKKKY